MQIILKENEQGKLCLFDTKSEKFFEGGCVSSLEAGKSLLATANDLAAKPTKKIIEIADSYVYSDSGYVEPMLAQKYLKLNPELRQLNTEKTQLKKDKRTILKEPGAKRGRPKKK
jgi:hypothetical protein